MTQSPTRKAEDRGSRVRLKLPLPALRLLRCFRRCLLPTFSHCCPPSHGSWRVSHQHASGIDTRCNRFTTARTKKQRYRLRKRILGHRATQRSVIARSKSNCRSARPIIVANFCALRENLKRYDEIRIYAATANSNNVPSAMIFARIAHDNSS